VAIRKGKGNAQQRRKFKRAQVRGKIATSTQAWLVDKNNDRRKSKAQGTP
jgi:hypothetical protein